MNEKDQYLELKDPELLTLALTLLSVAAGTGSLIISISKHQKEGRRNKYRVRRLLSSIDKDLGDLEEAFTKLTLLMVEQERLLRRVALGETLVDLNDFDLGQIKSARSNVRSVSLSIESALEDLSEFGDDVIHELALDISDQIRDAFGDAWSSSSILVLMLNLGYMLDLIAAFIDDVGGHYEYQRIHGYNHMSRAIEILRNQARREGFKIPGIWQ